ncbi:NmrA-like family protein [Fusarium oxysporum f. sp. albedinis]|nr:NmrA-like family protein [Fusarium oxysporum f. sp. albedinis]KAJ0134082.1 Uncharacterized protein HZ326_22863 [Fusarium oxysporum f. sp. albedinis]
MTTFRPSKVLVLGATGNIGQFITESLLDATPPFEQVAILTSPQTAVIKAELLDKWKKKNLRIITGDLKNDDEVKIAYQGVDTVISALGRNGLEMQTNLLLLAEKSDSVQWFFPSEFGTDVEYSPESATEKPNLLKFKVREYIRQNIKRLKYTFLVTGPYFELYATLPSFGRDAGGFDIAAREAVLIDAGNGQVGLTTMRDVGKALVATLQHPESCINKVVRVLSFFTTPNEILAEFEKQSGEKWNVSYVSLSKLKEAEKKAWADGVHYATLFTVKRIWAEDGAVIYEKLDNESIGIGGQSDMDTLETAVRRSLSRYK